MLPQPRARPWSKLHLAAILPMEPIAEHFRDNLLPTQEEALQALRFMAWILRFSHDPLRRCGDQGVETICVSIGETMQALQPLLLRKF